MSDTLIWGYKLRFIIELEDGRHIEVLNPLRHTGVVEVDTGRVLDAINDAQTDPKPPKFREVKLSV